MEMQRPQPEQACRDHEQSKLSRVAPCIIPFFFSFLFNFRGRCPVPAPVSDCHFTWQSDSSTELWFHPWLSGTDWVYVDNGQGIKPESRDKYPPSQEMMDDHLRWKAPRIMYAWFRKQLCGRLVEELYQREVRLSVSLLIFQFYKLLATLWFQ